MGLRLLPAHSVTFIVRLVVPSSHILEIVSVASSVRAFVALVALFYLPLLTSALSSSVFADEHLASISNQDFSVALSLVPSEQLPDAPVESSYVLDIVPVAQYSARSAPNVFVIQDPIRLVIDVPGVRSNTAELRIVERETVQSIRVGVHPDKLRVVIDIASTNEPTFSFDVLPASDNAPARIRVSFTVSGSRINNDTQATNIGNAHTLQVAQELLKQDPSQKEVARNNGVTTATVPERNETQSATVADAANALKQLAQASKNKPADSNATTSVSTSPTSEDYVDGLAVVESIAFKGENGGESIVLAVSSKSIAHKLSRISADKYELVINNANLSSDRLLLPQFPPRDFKGVEMLSAHKIDSNVVMRIYVTDSAEISSVVKGKSLVLQVK